MKTVTQITEWLKKEIQNNKGNSTTDGTDDIILGRSECAESLLRYIESSELPPGLQEKMNSIADHYLYRNYPRSMNGLFAYAKFDDIEEDVYFEDKDTDKDCYIFQICFGKEEEDYHKETHMIDIAVPIGQDFDSNKFERIEYKP